MQEFFFEDFRIQKSLSFVGDICQEKLYFFLEPPVTPG